jgi:ketosteroid isomerase-like protein
MRTLLITLAILVAGCPKGGSQDPVSPSAATPKEVVTAVKATVEQWRQGYEVRSVDTLAKLYAHDLDVVVVQEGATMIGWSSVEAYLKDRIARAGQIHIRLKDISVIALGLEAASVVATMTRELTDGTTTITENGTLTLVVRRTADGWVISSEHYSYKRP